MGLILLGLGENSYTKLVDGEASSRPLVVR
jgi:hypothetical protein